MAYSSDIRFVAIDILRESVIVYRRNVLRFVLAVLYSLVADLLVFGSLLGIFMLAFIALLALGLVKSIGIYILGPLFAILMISYFFFSSSFKGGLFGACFSIYQGMPMGLIDYLDYSIRGSLKFMGVALVFFIFALLVGIPIGLIYFFVKDAFIVPVSVVIGAIIYVLLALPFCLAIPACVVDNINAFEGVSRSLKTIRGNLDEFAIMLIGSAVLVLVLGVLPMLVFGIGVLLLLFIVLPIVISSFVIFYRSLRRF